MTEEKELRAKAAELAVRFWDMMPDITRNEAFIRIDPRDTRGRTELRIDPIGLVAEFFRNYIETGSPPRGDIEYRYDQA